MTTYFATAYESKQVKIVTNTDLIFHAASIIKPIILDSWINGFNESVPSWDTHVHIREDHYCKGSGVLEATKSVSDISLHDAAEMMITLSDNTASNVFIDQFSPAPENTPLRVTEAMQDLGYVHSEVRGWYGGAYKSQNVDFIPVSDELFSFECAGVTNVTDVLKSIKSLYGHENVRDMFERCQDLRGLKKDGVVPSGWVSGQKTGYVDGVRHVAGWLRRVDDVDSAVFMVVLTDSDDDSGAENWVVIDEVVAEFVDLAVCGDVCQGGLR